MSNPKLRILFLVDWYLPGYRAGGPIRSITNLVRGLGDEVECMVLTTDRDLGDHRPYEGVTTNSWVSGEFGERICYLSPDQLSRKRITELINDSGADVVHLNSMFSKPFTIWPLMDKAKGRIDARFMLAPRGMLAKGALSIKPFKKKTFLRAFKLKGWHRLPTWHASAEHEEEEIKARFGNVTIDRLPNFPAPVTSKIKSIPKEEGELRLICLTRIAKVKNLELLIEAIGQSSGMITLDLYGPKEDLKYFDRCEGLMVKLPDNIKASYQGEVVPKDVSDTIARYHVYALPTKGENFGHSIFEALAVGRPVIISDRTPWNHLGNAGKTIGLNDVSGWIQAIDYFTSMNQETWDDCCNSARAFAVERGEHDKLKDRYIKAFLNTATP